MNTTTIESTNNGIILAVADTDTHTHTHDSSKLPNRRKLDQDISEAKTKKEENKLYIQNTKGPMQHGELH